MNKKITILSLSVLGMAAFFLALGRKAVNQRGICINEVCSQTGRAIRDGVHDGSDYIELYNGSGKSCSLEGWYLSDDEKEPKKYALPEYELKPGAHMVFYADGTTGGFGLPFKIDAAGETIFLSNEKGILMDSVLVPELPLDVSYSRASDGAELWQQKEPTPGRANELGAMLVDTVLEPPVFSAASGFYEEPFFLRLSAKPGETIYYTLDGSIPDAGSAVYKEPLQIANPSAMENRYVSQEKLVKDWKNQQPLTEPVDKAVVVCAMVKNAAGEMSEAVTETYFVGLEDYQDGMVISFQAEPEELFGKDGIFVTGEDYDRWYENGSHGAEPVPNFFQRGRGWEATAQMQIFEDGKEVLQHGVGIRVQGNSSRAQALKRLSVFAREEYAGSPYFDSCILDKEGVHSFMLNEYLSNAAFPYLVEDRSVGIQQSRKTPAAVFINGEYWYTRYIMEKYNRHSLSSSFGVDADNVILIKNNEVHTGKPEDMVEFLKLQKLALSDKLTADEKYELLSEDIDMQSFIDFFAINVYLCNMNMNEKENYVAWRTREAEDSEYGDTRWRWLLYDLECVETMELFYYGVEECAQINSFSQRMDWIWTKMNENSIFMGLKDSEKFRRQFVLSFLDLANYHFAPERVEALLQEYGEDLSWRDGFFTKRFGYIVEDLKEEFALTGTLAPVTLSVNDPAGGTLLFNTVRIRPGQEGWTGQYYTDYPVTVTAEPSKGYRFAGFEGSIESGEPVAEIPVDPEGVELRAVFVPEAAP